MFRPLMDRTSGGCSLLDLPQELISNILAFVNQATLLNASSTCRVLNHIARRHLFSRLTLDCSKPDELERLYVNLFNEHGRRPALLAGVTLREVMIRIDDDDTNIPQAYQSLDALRSILRALGGAVTVSLEIDILASTSTSFQNFVLPAQKCIMEHSGDVFEKLNVWLTGLADEHSGYQSHVAVTHKVNRLLQDLPHEKVSALHLNRVNMHRFPESLTALVQSPALHILSLVDCVDVFYDLRVNPGLEALNITWCGHAESSAVGLSTGLGVMAAAYTSLKRLTIENVSQGALNETLSLKTPLSLLNLQHLRISDTMSDEVSLLREVTGVAEMKKLRSLKVTVDNLVKSAGYVMEVLASFPVLRKLAVHEIRFGSGQDADSSRHAYTALADLCGSRNIRLVTAFASSRCGTPADLSMELERMSFLSESLKQVSFVCQPTALGKPSVFRTVHLPRVESLSVTLSDVIARGILGGGVLATDGSEAVEQLLQCLRAPKCKDLQLIIYCGKIPLPDVTERITRVIARGTFPSLDRISGSILSSRFCEWDVLQRLVGDFRTACDNSGIDCRDFCWRSLRSERHPTVCGCGNVHLLMKQGFSTAGNPS